MTRFHTLFFAFRPPAPIATEVDRLRHQHRLPQPLVPRARLSVSLLSLGRHQVMPLRLIDQLSELIADETLPACRVEFDQLVSGRKCASLSASSPMQDIERLQAQLGGLLTNENIAFERRWSGPQMTLGYNVSGASRRVIDPLGWTASELVLIDSIYGEGKHLTMARWQLESRNKRKDIGGNMPGTPVRPIAPMRTVQERQLSLFA